MSVDRFGKIYTLIVFLYFIVSGLNAVFDIDAKLIRIGLTAVDIDGKIAFIVIYSSLMVGLGVAIALLYHFSQGWRYSTILAVTIISSFICFRVVGSLMFGVLSTVHLLFMVIEMIEVALGVFLLRNSGNNSEIKKVSFFKIDDSSN
ncbi:MAG: hypothetical protein HRU28_11670 [Rhizobiales bacterium]|nr:hypothetical protein [Hyphomicrobiales bacterium]